MSKIETIKLTQKEMEVYLSQRNYDIIDADSSTIDTDKVIKEAQNLGFNPYKLSGDGKYADTFIFIKEIDYRNISRMVNERWGRMGM